MARSGTFVQRRRPDLTEQVLAGFIPSHTEPCLFAAQGSFRRRDIDLHDDSSTDERISS